MIGFLHPSALAALPLAGLPVAVHLWGKARARPTPFSALDLLRDAAHTRFSTEKIRRWLLLAARTLLLLSLILFLAKPNFSGALGSQNVRGVILLDASYSLNAIQSGETAFDRARHIARTLVQSHPSDGRWGLVIFSDRVEKSLSPEEDPKIILQALETARPTFRGTSYAAGFAEAKKYLSKDAPVVLLSDLAAHGVFNQKGAGESPVGSVVAVEVISRRSNGGILGLPRSGGDVNFRAEILGWGETPLRTWSLRHGGRWEARGPVRWGNGRGVVKVNSGAGVSELALDRDALPTDDRWFFVNTTEKPFSICLVNGAPSLSPVGDEAYFLRPVLEGLSSVGIKAVLSSPGDLSTQNLSEIGAVVLLNPPPLSPATIERLTSFVKAGGGLWVTTGDRGGVLALAELLPLTQMAFREINEELEWSGSDLFPQWKGLIWDRVHVDRILAGTPRPGTQGLLRTARTKIPALTVSSLGRGRVALWGSTIDRDWTNLPAKPAFPVLVGSLLPWLSGNQGKENPSAYFVGDTIEREGDEDRPLRLQRPDGRGDRMGRTGNRWTYEKTDVPGVYEILGTKTEKVAVNVRPETEGDLTRMTPEMLKPLVGDVPVYWIPAGKARAEDVLIALQGRDLTPLVVWILFSLLFLETVLLFFPSRNRLAPSWRPDRNQALPQNE